MTTLIKYDNASHFSFDINASLNYKIQIKKFTIVW